MKQGLRNWFENAWSILDVDGWIIVRSRSTSLGGTVPDHEVQDTLSPGLFPLESGVFFVLYMDVRMSGLRRDARLARPSMEALTPRCTWTYASGVLRIPQLSSCARSDTSMSKRPPFTQIDPPPGVRYKAGLISTLDPRL